jgi:hypothetical protein
MLFAVMDLHLNQPALSLRAFFRPAMVGGRRLRLL